MPVTVLTSNMDRKCNTSRTQARY